MNEFSNQKERLTQEAAELMRGTMNLAFGVLVHVGRTLEELGKNVQQQVKQRCGDGEHGPATTTSLFSLHAPEAKQVYVAGDFNGWNGKATPMGRNDDGTWRAELTLAPGRHAYKFVVDGEWRLDPNNPETANDGLGGRNSLRIID